MNAWVKNRTNKLGYINSSGSIKHGRKGFWKESQKNEMNCKFTISTISLLIKIHFFSFWFFFCAGIFLTHHGHRKQNQPAKCSSSTSPMSRYQTNSFSGSFFLFLNLPALFLKLNRKTWGWFILNLACSNNVFSKENSPIQVSSSNELPFSWYVNFFASWGLTKHFKNED